MIVLAGNVSPAAGGVERSVAAMARELMASGKDVRYLEVHPGTAPDGLTALSAHVAWGRGPAVLLNPGRLRRALEGALTGSAGGIEQIWARNPHVAAAAASAVPDVPCAYLPPGIASEILPAERVHRGRGVRGLLRDAYWRLLAEPAALDAEDRAVRRSRVIVTFSENLRLWLERDYGPEVAARVRVVPPGVDTERFRPRRDDDDDPLADLSGAGGAGAARSGAGRPGASPRLAFLGRLEARKGATLFLEALALLPEATGVIVGSGPEEAEVRRAVAALRLADRVALVGHRPDAERWLRACDVFVIPSTVEPFGHVMLEAMASGLPVVGFSRASGARVATEDVVEDGRTGALVEEVSGPGLAAGVRRVLDLLAGDPALPGRCRAAAERHDWASYVTGVGKALQDA